MRRYITALLLLCSLHISAQSLDEADKYYKEFQSVGMTGQQSPETYDKLYKACEIYRKVLENSEKGTPDYLRSREQLLMAFNFLGEAAYYFTEKDDEDNTVKYATAFVEVSIMSQLADKDLTSRPGYAQFPYFLANRAHRENRFQDAISYYRAYLQTGDDELVEHSYVGLVLAFNELKNYDEAISHASLAVRRFPDNATIINQAIMACEKGMVDDNLQHFLDLALRLKPGDETLTEKQADLFERQREFAKAVDIYSRLFDLHPDNLNTTCHLGVDYFNRGVQLYEDAQLAGLDGEVIMKQANEYFSKAAPLLDDVLGSKPWAVNFARSLAHCYNMLGDAESLKQANRDLAEQKMPKVKAGDTPVFQINYNPEVRDLDVAGSDSLSYVDIDIPQVVKANSNTNTYAIIIGNENYKYLQQVKYAHNDARTFAKYCETVLGMPTKNIKLVTEATKAEMDDLFNGITERARLEPGKLRFIIYYAGHGHPDITQGVSYLIPSNVDASNFSYCCSLTDLYDRLDKANTLGVTVFLDACFSGASRAGGPVKEGRFVYIDAPNTTIGGKTVSFSAASGKEASLPYHKEHHGIFTYVLLKNLKDKRGNISYGELAENLKAEVGMIALDDRNSKQTPTVSYSDAIADTWQDMKLINK